MRLLILCLFLIFAANALAANDFRSNALPLFQNGERSFLPAAALGPVCSSIRGLLNTPTCNPALLGEPRESQNSNVGLNVFGGLDIDVYKRNREALGDQDKNQLVQSLLSERDPIRAEASSLLWWRGERAAVSFQPLRATYFSSVRNQAYPDLSLQGLQEQSLQGQVGGFLDENWRFGAQLRFVDRRYVYEEFNLFSALPDFKGRFEVQKQQALFLEPGLAYEFSQTEELRRWKPLFSLYLSQAGWVKSANDSRLPVDPLLDAGFGISPPVELGEWELGLNYRWTPQVSMERRLRLGSVYRIGILEFTGGLDEQNWSLGAMAQLWNFSAGLLHKRNEISRSGGEPLYDQSTYLEIRLIL